MANEWAVPAGRSRMLQEYFDRIYVVMLDALDLSIPDSLTIIEAIGDASTPGGWIEVIGTPRITLSASGTAGGTTTVTLHVSDDKVNEEQIAAFDLAVVGATFERAEGDVYTRFIRIKAISSVAGPLTDGEIRLTARSLG